MFDRNAHQRAYRLRTGNQHTKTYERTPSGFLMRAYRNMQSRVQGVQWRKAHLYFGLPLLPRAEFYEWAKNDPEFLRLFDEWKAAGYPRVIAPSVNRINTALGYTLDNIEWIVFRENCRLGGLSRRRRERCSESDSQKEPASTGGRDPHARSGSVPQ